MKKLLFTAVFALIGITVFAQTHLYVNPKFGEIAKGQKIIAILPFKTTISLRPNQMKNITNEKLAEMEISEGESIQTALNSWFLSRGKRLTVEIQAPAVTNVMLKKAGVTTDNISDHTPGDLAKILGVDAVVMGTLQTTKPMSQAASGALQLAFGLHMSTNQATMNLFIYNGSDSQMLLNYDKGVSGSFGSDTESLINTLMRKASRRIAYVSN